LLCFNLLTRLTDQCHIVGEEVSSLVNLVPPQGYFRLGGKQKEVVQGEAPHEKEIGQAPAFGKGSMAKESPKNDSITREDSRLKRYMRGSMSKWYVNAFNVFFALGAATTAGWGFIRGS
jgi:hypothetical protein